jgi:MFS family permease
MHILGARITHFDYDLSMQKHDPFKALKNPDFAAFSLFRFLFTVAFQMQAVVVSWQMFELTRDPLSLGLIGLAEFLPALSVALFAGHLSDIKNRKHIAVWTSSLALVTVGLLLFFTIHQDEIYSLYGTLPFYLIIGINGIVRGFLSPSIFSLLGDIVPKEDYLNSSTWSSTIWQIGAITGPALGGIFYTQLGLVKTYIIEFVLLTIAIFLFSRVRYVHTPKAQTESMVNRMLEGIKFVFNTPVLLHAMSLDLFAVLFGGAVALLPIFANDILKVGPDGLGMLRSAPAVGSAIVAIFILYLPPIKNAGKVLMLNIAGFGIATIAFAFSTNFYFSLFCLFMTGVFDNVSVVIRSTIFQTQTPAEMKGRVAAVNSIFIGSSNEVGAFESGLAAKIMGVVPSVIFGGSMTILIVLGTAFRSKKLRDYKFH